MRKNLLTLAAVLPGEVQDALPTLPDGSTPSSSGSAADIHSENMILAGNFDDGAVSA